MAIDRKRIIEGVRGHLDLPEEMSDADVAELAEGTWVWDTVQFALARDDFVAALKDELRLAWKVLDWIAWHWAYACSAVVGWFKGERR